MGAIFNCELGEASNCGECQIFSLNSMGLRAEIAALGGEVYDELPAIAHTGEIKLTGAVIYGAFRRVIETRGTSLDSYDEGHALDAVKNAHEDPSCVRA